MIDGVRMESSSLGGPIWNAIPVSSIDHIEIIYGPLSTMYGADAMGGIIQIFTKKGVQKLNLTLLVVATELMELALTMPASAA
jgi:vitamin B12 transporter